MPIDLVAEQRAVTATDRMLMGGSHLCRIVFDDSDNAVTKVCGRALEQVCT